MSSPPPTSSKRGAVWVVAAVLTFAAIPGNERVFAPSRAPAAPPGATADWQRQILRRIEAEQRLPHATATGFSLRGGGLRAELGATGAAIGDWRFELREKDAAAAVPQLEGTRVVFHRSAHVTEWYEAKAEGIEQGFTIDQRPSADLQVRGWVRGARPPEGPALTFGTMSYGKLQAFDARGRSLPATTEWTQSGSGDCPPSPDLLGCLALTVAARELVDAEFPVVLDPLLTSVAWVADPTDQTSAFFGISVAGAGDVNRDGFTDVIVGAPNWDGLADEGRAYLFLGGPAGLSTTAAWTANPTGQAGANFGSAVASAGDVNNDGYADVVIAANNWDGAGANEGRAFLYLGNAAGLSAGPAWIADPTDQTNGFFGAVAGAGDVNGDGFSDVIVGAQGFDTAASPNEGRAYLYLGNPNGLDALPVWVVDPTDQQDALFGISVAGAGDVNGDGFADVLIGAQQWNGQFANKEGRAYLYLGSAAGLSPTPDWTADPTNQPDAYFGTSVASAGDVNGDGFADVLIGAPRWNGAQSEEGRAYLFLGSAAGLATLPAWTSDPTDQLTALFGSCVASAGDVNGDGYADLLIGAERYNGAAAAEGRAYLYLGSATGPAQLPSWTSDPTDTPNAVFGASLAGVGDVNGDGFADVVVGAPRWDGQAVDEGRTYLFLGSASGPASTASLTQDPTDQDGARFGVTVAGAGDVNGDGFADVIVGASGWSSAISGEGRAYLYLGGAAGLASIPSWTSDPTDQVQARFGSSVASAGDVNGDGFADVIIGAPGWQSAVGAEGRAYLFLGSATGLAAVPAARLDPSDLAGANFGVAVAGAGDVNGDGFADVIIGAYSWGIAFPVEGRAYVYYGSAAGLSPTPDWVADPTDQMSAFFGGAVASAGDVNNDGFSDVLVGAQSFSANVANEGRAYLYLGSANGLSASAAWTADPTDQSGSYFGQALAGAGDVNGDGFADVVIGAGQWSSSIANEGRAYVYLGNPGGLATTPAWTQDPNDQPTGLFGSSVASAGDVNGDGFADVLIGASQAGSAFPGEGRAYLYLGGSAGLATTPALVVDPVDQTNAYFGSSVASAGDLNGDGFSDLIIGAYRWTNAVSAREGRSYVYLGGDGAPGLPRSLGQFRADGLTRIGVGDDAAGTVVVFKGRVTQEGKFGGRLRFEVLVHSTAFVTSQVAGTSTTAGQLSSVTLTLPAGPAYRWSARVLYPGASGHGRWVEFSPGSNGNADFRVSTGADGGPGDGGAIDAGAPDAGTIDGGQTDAGDGGSTDGGSTDGGSTDGGSTDGGSTDGGSTDAGSTDAGSTDGGSTDGGSTDGGSTDGGRIDAGSSDAGLAGPYVVGCGCNSGSPGGFLLAACLLARRIRRPKSAASPITRS